MNSRLSVILYIFCLNTSLAKTVTRNEKSKIDYSNYRIPVYRQIVNRIKIKINSRLDNYPGKSDRYFVIPFAYEDKDNQSEQSHTFATLVQVSSHRRLLDYYTISWLPDGFGKNSELCVFSSFWAIIFPRKNTCPSVKGKNFTLAETVNLATPSKDWSVEKQNKFSKVIAMWGPYEITPSFFKAGYERVIDLQDKITKYKADDRLTSNPLEAINCFHATSRLDFSFRKGGFLNTGFKQWGIKGTINNIIEYKEKRSDRLLEKVDENKDLYRFVYVRDLNQGAFKDFKNSSAYYQ